MIKREDIKPAKQESKSAVVTQDISQKTQQEISEFERQAWKQKISFDYILICSF